MQTSLLPSLLETRAGKEADRILRACVHCGFCTATCPTYQLLGDELDGPRGRIYLIKQVLEGTPATRLTQQHLDRCLTCRACETTCPSGVHYSRLLDIGREIVEAQVGRSLSRGVQRYLLRKLLPYPARFRIPLRLGQWLSPVLPARLRRKIPRPQKTGAVPPQRHARRMLLLDGCAQSVATPNTNAAARRLLDRLGISLVSARGQGCCGAVSQHLSAPEEARHFVRRNIDAWWPYIEQGVEAILVNASGCAVQVKDYGHLMQDDAEYAEKATRVATMARDLAEVLSAEDLSPLTFDTSPRVAFHAPCTLQHGQKLNGVVEGILRDAGFTLTAAPDAHLCCGSAGTYSLLQPGLSQQLLGNKLRHLQSQGPDVIATANVGCQLHLQSGTSVPVRHWIELLDERLR